MTKFTLPFVFALIISFLLITTCTTDNSITGNSKQSLTKPLDLLDINSPSSDDDDECFIAGAINEVYDLYGIDGVIIAMINKLLDKDYLDGVKIHYPDLLSKRSYDFRDNFLSKSEKGRGYTEYYYELSKYGIKNNLVNQYPLEHLELLLITTEIAQDLQYDNSNDQVLINNDIAEKMKDMLKVYQNQPNHRDIDPVLDFLELELNKYQNKPKSEILADFK